MNIVIIHIITIINYEPNMSLLVFKNYYRIMVSSEFMCLNQILNVDAILFAIICYFDSHGLSKPKIKLPINNLNYYL